MNKIFLYLFLLVNLQVFSQINFEKGFFIKNSNEKIECLIKNNDWNKNPTDFEYKIFEKDEEKFENILNV